MSSTCFAQLPPVIAPGASHFTKSAALSSRVRASLSPSRRRPRAKAAVAMSGTPAAAAPSPVSVPVSVPACPEPTTPVRDIDVTSTHKTADFDSLGAAVGLALLRGRDECKVIIPAGESAPVARYLGLFRGQFPIVDVKSIDPERLRYVGIVDCSEKKRLGPVASFLDLEGVAVEVIDHHVHGLESCDIPTASITNEPVGAVTTIIVERLRARPDITLTRSEATLFAIAIHADTGNLTYENTTSRDVAALAWLMECGACTRQISQFGRDYLADDQKRLLTTALDSMTIESVNGQSIASCLVETSDFVKGSAHVAQVVLELSNVDAFLFGVATPATRAGRRAAAAGEQTDGVDKQVSLIGRARSSADGVDFSAIFRPHGGGGHCKAASASVRVSTMEDASGLVAGVVEGVKMQLPEPILVNSFMSTEVVSVKATDSMSVARDALFEHGHTGLAVVTSSCDTGEESLVGVVSRQDVALAERKNLLDTPVKGWIARKVVSVAPETPLFEAEAMLAENKIGRLPVVQDGKVVGIVTRSDVLIQRRFLVN